jgi:AcrR family transcriptional regulator
MTRQQSSTQHAFQDLTARARIRDAALQHFADEGFARATIRDIARTAGVSPGLVRHHFGSKEALRDACDAYVAEALRVVNDDSLAASRDGDLGLAAVSRQGLRPYQGYLSRALVDGSPSVAGLFDDMVAMGEQWLVRDDENRTDPPLADRTTRSALIAAMALGIPLLHQHISRAVGVDIRSDEGDRRVAMALLDIYSHPMVTPELAATARDVVERPSRPTPRDAEADQHRPQAEREAEGATG